MNKEYVLIFKTKNMTDRQQTRMVMESHSIVKKISPKSRTIVAIEKKEGK